jgi:protein involved in polysaccharide export with SLBB domain
MRSLRGAHRSLARAIAEIGGGRRGSQQEKLVVRRAARTRAARGWIAAFSLALVCASVQAADEPPPAPGPLRYQIERGDRLDIKVFNVNELSQEVVVRPDGKISATILDDVEAAGRTPDELAAALQEGWSKVFTDPRVTVVVREFATRNVFVGGEVAADGMVPLRHRMTALGAVIAAGGFRATAQTSNVIVVRDAGGRPEALKVDARRVLDGSIPDLELAPFDVVYVPKSKIARVNLFVEQYIKYVLPINLNGAIQYNYLTGGM